MKTATASRAAPKLRPSVRTAPTATASVRPKAQPGAAKPQDVAAAKPKAAAPERQANAYAPPPGTGMINGAQPVVPAGNFNSRWAGF